MTTTALVPYTRAPEPDAGRGLRFRRGWLVSTPSAAHVRWLAPWIQAVIADAWNLPGLAVRSLVRRLVRDPLWRPCAAMVGWAAAVAVLIPKGPEATFVAGVIVLVPLAWRLSIELTETREAGA